MPECGADYTEPSSENAMSPWTCAEPYGGRLLTYNVAAPSPTHCPGCGKEVS